MAEDVTVRGPEPLQIETDVLIVGGGMAACWAGISAARAGAKVVLVDKGYVGTSGVTATAGPGHWWVSPDGNARKEAIDKRLALAHGLGDPGWMERIIDTTWRVLPTLAKYYRFNINDRGQTAYNALRGPEYLRALRHAAIDAGVTILDQSPALELLLHGDGSVAGVNGVRRQEHRAYAARAGGVILATGGAGFLGGLLGSSTNTGDGHLMAIEAGAELSGMEFSNEYSISPRWNSTRTLIYSWARYFDAEGNELDVLPTNYVLERALVDGPVYALLNECPEGLRKVLTQIQPMTLLPFVRKGITDVYEKPFEVKLFPEGTIRGTGGLRIAGERCETTIPGLFAAGDTATRELIAGATTGGGSPNSAWALTSGLLSGAGAAALAQSRGRRLNSKVRALGTVGLRPRGSVKAVDRRSVLKAAQDEILPLDKNVFRSGDKLRHSLRILESAWRELREHDRAIGTDAVSARETASVVATARLCYTAALTRDESRGMHQREDVPEQKTEQQRRLLIGGLDDVWTRPEASAQWSPSHV
ncbi:MAG TPA: FAD-binding protein [Polyangiaceae bacterium]|nr:FAD-binding protein [Polyangiaceae bacterium]